MYLVLIYRPEADAEPHKAEPFAGIEIGLLTSSKLEADEYLNEMGDAHADWHFCLMPMSASN